MSKGSIRRPKAVSNGQWAENWESVFGKKEPDAKVNTHSCPYKSVANCLKCDKHEGTTNETQDRQ